STDKKENVVMSGQTQKTSFRIGARLGTLIASAALFVSACGTATDSAEKIGETQDALTAAQCVSGAVGNKVALCHATGSAKNPYVRVDVAVAGCISGHAGHPNDYLATNDPTCSGTGACRAVGASCDGSHGCCDGLACTNGTCQQPNKCAG